MRLGMTRGSVEGAACGSAGRSPGTWGTRTAAGVLALAAAAGLLWFGGCGQGKAVETSPRADLLYITPPGPAEQAERPPVQFPHDLHTEALAAQGKDCSTCHLTQEDGNLSPLFMRLDTALAEFVRPGEGAAETAIIAVGGAEAVREQYMGGERYAERAEYQYPPAPAETTVVVAGYGDSDVDAIPSAKRPAAGKDELMHLYHDNCVGCHTKMNEAGRKAGPLACGDCHRDDPLFVSSARPFGMDKSLHYRHLMARHDKCEDCHHVYDRETGKLIYKKGEESSCRDCHLKKTVTSAVAFKVAAHWECIRCHLETAKQGPDTATGPRACGGCHSLKGQRAIKVIKDVPRLKMNQPDFVLVSAPEDEIHMSTFRTVPFPHEEHEAAASNCRVCHHETLKSCTKCHTLPGEEEGDGVTLRTAMHQLSSDHSCVGCHDLEKEHTECAGCHNLMQQGYIPDSACPVCHSGPLPQNLRAERARYTSMSQFEPSPESVRLTFTAADIPDSVVIGVLSKDYEPAVMPHGKIVKKLREYIKESKVAAHFHVREDVMCQGCHHNGSVGARPALCENCHGRPFDEAHLYRPGLYGAFHQQCMGCHESMELPKPLDCAGCHRKKAPEESGVRAGIVKE